MDRRKFLETLGVAGVISIAEASGVGFGVTKIKASSRSANDMREIPLRLEDTPELKDPGGMYIIEAEDIDKEIIVAHLRDGEFVALDVRCTHKGCKISFKLHKDPENPKDDEEPYFGCPCHDSKFDLTGKPTGGPAKKPLKKYDTTFDGKEVVVKIPLDE
jgi:Rieske Fe-S protein